MKIIRGKKALVTGAASGIGRAIALELAKEGAELFLIDIDREKLADTARELAANNVNVVTACCDLSEARSDQQRRRRASSRVGRAQHSSQQCRY